MLGRKNKLPPRPSFTSQLSYMRNPEAAAWTTDETSDTPAGPPTAPTRTPVPGPGDAVAVRAQLLTTTQSPPLLAPTQAPPVAAVALPLTLPPILPTTPTPAPAPSPSTVPVAAAPPASIGRTAPDETPAVTDFPDDDGFSSDDGFQDGDGESRNRPTRRRLFRRGRDLEPAASESDEWSDMPADLVDRPARKPGRKNPAGTAGAGAGRKNPVGLAEGDSPQDYEVRSVSGGFGSTVTKWGARVLLGLLLFAGVNQVIIKPIRGNTGGADTAVATDAISAGQASRVAGVFTADYLTFNPADLPSYRTRLAATLEGTADVDAIGWTGKDTVTADVVFPGEVTIISDTRAVVAVTARITTTTASAAPAAASTDPAAGTDPVATGTAPGQGGPVWVSLLVPVVDGPGGVRVSQVGPVFTTDPAPIIPPGFTASSPTDLESTRSRAQEFFTAYAHSSVDYLAAPGVSLAGLGDVLTFDSLTTWTVASNPADTNQLAGSAAVLWALPGTDLQTRQNYSVLLTRDDDRWYVTGLGTDHR